METLSRKRRDVVSRLLTVSAVPHLPPQDLSCREELLTLLLSLLPLVWRIPVLEGMPQGKVSSSLISTFSGLAPQG